MVLNHIYFIRKRKKLEKQNIYAISIISLICKPKEEIYVSGDNLIQMILKTPYIVIQIRFDVGNKFKRGIHNDLKTKVVIAFIR